MKWLKKLLLAQVEKEEGDFSSFIEKLEAGDFNEKMNYGIAADKRGFLLVDPVQQPGALYCGGMGSGKSVAMRFTLITHMLANSENTFYVLVDPLKGMTDYAILFKDDRYKKNVAVALNDTAKLIPVIEMIYQECMTRKEEFSRVNAKNIYDYEDIMKKKDSNFSGLARIIIAMEEFHSVPNAEQIKYHMNSDRIGSPAEMLKTLLRIGRSYGITLLAATQRATSDDFPSSLKPGITQLMAFRVNNPGDATAINLPAAADILMSQRGRCVYESGFIQFPYLDDDASSKLLKKYYKPLKAKLLKFSVEKYHEAFSGEGNQGMVQVKTLKSLIENYQSFKVEDIITRILEAFDFKVTPQTNTALPVNLIAQRDDLKYAVLITAGRGSVSEKGISSFKEGAKILECNRMIAISMDGPISSSVNTAVNSLKGYALDNEDLQQIARVLDNKTSLEREGKFEVLYEKIPLIKREVKEEAKEEREDEIENDEEKESNSSDSYSDDDLLSAFSKAAEKSPEPAPKAAISTAPVSEPKLERPKVATGGSQNLMDLRERLRASLKSRQ